MDLVPIVDYLVTQNVGVKGKSLFVAQMPVSCKQGILFRDSAAGSKIDWNLPGYYKTTFTAIARGQNYLACDALIKSAMAALTMYEYQLPGSFLIRRLLPQNLPNTYALDEGAYYEMSVRFELVFNA